MSLSDTFLSRTLHRYPQLYKREYHKAGYALVKYKKRVAIYEYERGRKLTPDEIIEKAEQVAIKIARSLERRFIEEMLGNQGYLRVRVSSQNVIILPDIHLAVALKQTTSIFDVSYYEMSISAVINDKNKL